MHGVSKANGERYGGELVFPRKGIKTFQEISKPFVRTGGEGRWGNNHFFPGCCSPAMMRQS
jgi:hypothetical protein